MRWRSPREIAFRLRQEVRNLALFARPPVLPDGTDNASAPFPDPEAAVRALRGTRAAEAITTWAGEILLHRFPLLGLEIDTGPEIRWRHDYVSGKETPPAYFRTIPYLDRERAGDHKIIWELNRHQHLVLLAQAHLLTGREEFLREIDDQLASWFEANRFQRGINWASALEVAFRSLSWMWVDHLVGARMQPETRRRLRNELYRHALHLEANLSMYFSPNTHLLGETVALHALGRMFRGMAGAEAWERRGAQVVSEEMERQVRSDGSHFEQSSYYHVYALDMFLFHAILTQPSESYCERLRRMAQYLAALMGPNRSLPSLGDDDGGRFFHPFGARDRFGRATLAACGCFLGHPEWAGDEEDLHEYAAWWLGPRAVSARAAAPSASRWFADAGVAVMRAGAVHCIMDAGPFGALRAGHSHADALSIVARTGSQELLIDPGTFTYSDSGWRDVFRGTAAHSTVRVNGLDQADGAGAFGWRNLPEVTCREWHANEPVDFLDAECRSRGIRHRRRVVFVKPELLFVLDDIEGGQLAVEQFWHPGGPVETLTPACFRIAGAGALVLGPAGIAGELSEAGEFGWRSPVMGVKQPAPLIVCRQTGEQRVRLGAVLAFSAPPISISALEIVSAGEEITMILSGAWQASVAFQPSGLPTVRYNTPDCKE